MFFVIIGFVFPGRPSSPAPSEVSLWAYLQHLLLSWVEVGGTGPLFIALPAALTYSSRISVSDSLQLFLAAESIAVPAYGKIVVVVDNKHNLILIINNLKTHQKVSQSFSKLML